MEALRYLMQEQDLTQADAPEVGAQSVNSEILAASASAMSDISARCLSALA